MTEMTQGGSSTVDGPTLKPGIKTTEFWQAMFVHLFSTVSALAVFFNVNLAHLTSVQALIPTAALLASLVAQAAYHSKRADLKGQQVAAWAKVNVARVAGVSTVVNNYTPIAEAVGRLIAPVQEQQAEDALNKIEGAVAVADEAWHRDMRDVPSPDPAPSDVAEQSVPVVGEPARSEEPTSAPESAPYVVQTSTATSVEPSETRLTSVTGTGAATYGPPAATSAFDPDSPAAGVSQA